MTESTITLGGNELKMRYCAAAETGFEALAHKSLNVFIPHPEIDDEGNIVKDEDGKTIYNQPEASLDDYIRLGVAAIIAAYTIDDNNPPLIDGMDVTRYVLYAATPSEVKSIISSVSQLRSDWYAVPEVVKTENSESEKN